MNRNLLQKARDYIEILNLRDDEGLRFPEDEDEDEVGFFDMRIWGDIDDCGTTACLAGWLTESPEMQHEGLSRPSEYNYLPLYGDYEGMEALEQFFEITSDEASFIFSEGNPNNVQEALERLDKVIAGKLRENL